MPRRRRTPQAAALQSVQGLLASPRFNGAVLVTVSTFTLLSLVSGSQGRVTALWIDLLQRGFGAAIWGIPFVLGFLGFWIIIRSLELRSHLAWQQPWGLLLLFLCCTTAIALAPGSMFLDAARLLAPFTELPGGWIGRFLGQQLLQQLGPQGAWLALTLLSMSGLYMLQKSLVLRGLGVVQRALEALWEWMGRVPEGGYRLKPWRETTAVRFLGWLFAQRSALRPLFSLYRGLEQRYFATLRNLRSGAAAAAAEARERPPPDADALPAGERIVASPPRASADAASTREPAAAAPPPRAALAQEPLIGEVRRTGNWSLPVLDQVLDSHERVAESDDHVRDTGVLLQETLGLFGVPATFEGAYKGPSVTQYLIKPGYTQRFDSKGRAHRTKVKVNKITALSNDLALAVAAQSVRIEAPIPGTSYVGVEISNSRSNSVSLKELFRSEQFRSMEADLPLALGEDVKGQPIVADLAKMPHLLIAGATGTGKSVCINAIITTLLLSHSPDTLRFLMIDPKMVELSEYNDIPHMIKRVVIDVEEAEGALDWCVQEMDRRYHLLNKAMCRDIRRYNVRCRDRGERQLPYVVVVIDEMADLMMMAPQEVEQAICRLAQMARAVGIHLIVATQRPSVDVITGLIKANFPARIAFAVSSQTDSRVIIDGPGAERLLGKGDMLFVSPDASRTGRVQGTWVSDLEIHRVVQYWKDAQLQKEEVQEARAQVQDWLAQQDDPAAAAESLGATETQAESPGPQPSPGWDSEAAVHHISARAAEENPTPAMTSLQTEAGTPEYAAETREETLMPEEVLPDPEDPPAAPDLYDQAVTLAESGTALSVSLLQRRLKVGRTKALSLIDRMLEAEKIDEDLLDSQTFMALVRFRDARR